MNLSYGVLTTCAAAAAAILLSGCSPKVESNNKEIKPLTVKTHLVTSNLDQSKRSFPAKIAASDSTNLSFKVAGQIEKIHVKAGDKVTKGQTILELDDTDFQLSYDQAKANYDLAKSTFERVNKINKQNIATQADVDNAQANLDLTKAGFEQAKNQLRYTKLIAPYSGLVVAIVPKQFEFTGAAQPVAVIQSQENIDIKFQIPSDLIAQVNSQKPNQQIDVRFDAIKDRVFKADVKEFKADGDSSTRSFATVVTMERPDESIANLLPGMDAYVEVDLSLFRPEMRTLVPSTAVFSIQSTPHVYKIFKGKTQLQAVEVGELANDQIEVIKGLNVGDLIVATGGHKLTDNQSITQWQAK